MNDGIQENEDCRLFSYALQLTHGNWQLAEEAIQHLLVQQWR